jgi:TPR repeat protein
MIRALLILFLAGCQPKASLEGMPVPAKIPLKFETTEEILQFADRLRYGDENTARDFTAAAEFYQQACEDQEARACLEYASQLARGIGLRHDPEAAATRVTPQAVREVEERCKYGEGRSCTLLASIYIVGVGMPADPEKGFELLEEACEIGDGPGCASLGVHYQAGLHVEQDLDHAVSLAQKACEMGDG